MYSLLCHLALALAGLCLTWAEYSFIPEIIPIGVVYLALVWLSYRCQKRWLLPPWLAHILGLAVVVAVGGWIWLRIFYDEAGWAKDIELPGSLIPYLSALIMGLLLVRLFRPLHQDDFWLQQSLGMLLAALACVLADGVFFGLLLFAYLAVVIAAVAVHERIDQARRTGDPLPEAESALQRSNWYRAARWGAAVIALAWPLFLLTPRLDGPEWQPAARFGVRQTTQQVRTGFSHSIDLNNATRLENDDSVAFVVTVLDTSGKGVTNVPVDQHWRGVTLDHYDKGHWRCDLTWARTSSPLRPPPPPGRVFRSFRFDVPAATNAFPLATPVLPGRIPGELPIREVENYARIPFFEAAGTISLPMNLPDRTTHRYEQIFHQSYFRTDRVPVTRVSDEHFRRISRVRIPGLEDWTIELLRRLARRASQPELLAALEGPRPPGWTLPPEFWEQVARLLTNHLSASGEYTYSLTNERTNMSLDPVLDFLTNVRTGSCERYASALALMLRSVQIPARLIKGYRGADHRGDGVYDVRQSNAHAWVETVVLALPREDTMAGEPVAMEWLTLDPTPNLEQESDWARWWQEQQRSGQGLWRNLIQGYDSRQQADLWTDLTNGRLLWRALPVLLVAGSVLLVTMIARRAQRWQRRSGVRGLYERLLALLTKRFGVTPDPTRTPSELAEEAADKLRANPATAQLADVPGEVVAMYYRRRYGGERIDPMEVASLGRKVDELSRVS